MGKSSFVGKRNGYGCKRSVFMAYTQANLKQQKTAAGDGFISSSCCSF
ncbi:hypothetical protein Lpp48_15924 [Lacticaseibacillus paracasei subsp. paracasei Lpp48]|nr:hypothetical protein Lpp48_15924 [Lacticaseibacillus paracasei subsp. paracasei Lpp48]